MRPKADKPFIFIECSTDMSEADEFTISLEFDGNIQSSSGKRSNLVLAIFREGQMIKCATFKTTHVLIVDIISCNGVLFTSAVPRYEIVEVKGDQDNDVDGHDHNDDDDDANDSENK